MKQWGISIILWDRKNQFSSDCRSLGIETPKVSEKLIID